MNESKSGIGRGWERKFLGFRLTRKKQIEIAPESLKKFQEKVRELWRSCQSRSSEELRDGWKRYLQGWWGYFRLAEHRRPVFKLEGWIRRHIRKCFWLRWHGKKGRVAALRRLGVRDRMLQVASSSLGAWRLARTGVLHRALSNAVLLRYGFVMPSDLAASS